MKTKKRFTKLIKESYKYFETNCPSYIPIAEDIISDVIGMIQEEIGYIMTEKDIKQLTKEVIGE